MSKTLAVAMTPEPGYVMIGDSAELFFTKISEHGGNLSLPCERLGVNPAKMWSDDEADDFPVTGYAVETLLEVVAKMGTEWDCQVSFLPNYHSALYAATKQKIVDVAYCPFLVDAQQSYCGPEPPSATQIPGCPVYNESVTWQTATPLDACCASFNYPMMVNSVGGLVSRADNEIGQSSTLDLATLAEASNLLAWLMVIVIILGNLVWLVEKVRSGATDDK